MRRIQLTVSILVLAALTAACGLFYQSRDLERTDGWCDMGMSAGATATNLGPQDLHAAYHGFMAPVKKGERAVFRSRFAHARYISFVLYDEDFKAIDALRDYQIVPGDGVNPFVDGVDRSADYLGSYEIQILMEDPPAGERPANTLYAGRQFDGDPNRVAVLGYRVYLPDEKYGQAGDPLSVFGGVEPPVWRLEGPDGDYCPDKKKMKPLVLKVIGSIINENKSLILNPTRFQSAAFNPPVWRNEYSREGRRDNTYVGNDDTQYLWTPISSDHGELLVLRWQAAKTPRATYEGGPFEPGWDMRYWSLSFAYIDRATPFSIYTEKTLADVEVPTLPDGTSQLVIGFNGMARPDYIPTEQWVGLKMKKGMIIMRNIVIDPDYAGDFGRLERGWVPADFDQYTPGGVYCSPADFAHNPDLGLERHELILAAPTPKER